MSKFGKNTSFTKAMPKRKWRVEKTDNLSLQIKIIRSYKFYVCPGRFCFNFMTTVYFWDEKAKLCLSKRRKKNAINPLNVYLKSTRGLGFISYVFRTESFLTLPYVKLIVKPNTNLNVYKYFRVYWRAYSWNIYMIYVFEYRQKIKHFNR